MEEAKNRLINVFNNKDYTNALTIVKEVLAEYPSLLNEHIVASVVGAAGSLLILSNCTEYTDVFQYLLQIPEVNVNYQAIEGYTALHWASVEHTKLLLARSDLDLNIKTKSGDTPLLFTLKITSPDPEKWKLLLSHPNIDINAQDNRGWTFFHKVLEQFHRPGRFELIDLLLADPRVDSTVTDKDGYPPLFRLSTYLYSPKWLNHPKIDVNFQNEKGNSALHFWCQYTSHSELIKSIVAVPRINPNLVNTVGDTPLHIAVSKGMIDNMKALFTHPHVNIEIKNKNSQNATEICQKSKHDYKVAMLRELAAYRDRKSSTQESHQRNKEKQQQSTHNKNEKSTSKSHEDKNIKDTVAKELHENQNDEKPAMKKKSPDVNPTSTKSHNPPSTSKSAINESTLKASKNDRTPSSEVSLPKANPKDTDDDRYMKEALAQGKKEWGRSKIMLVGEGRAGKTALANSILGRMYESTDSTIGINEFTVNVGYASVGGGEGVGTAASLDNGEWSEYRGHKEQKEYEVALARLIADQKAGRLGNEAGSTKAKTETREDDLELWLNSKMEGGYVAGEEGMLMSYDELERGLEGETRGLSHQEIREVQKVKEHSGAPRKEAKVVISMRQDDGNAREGTMIGKGKSKETTFTSNNNKSNNSGGSNIAKTSEIDKSLVMQYLGEKTCVDSKFIVSVFDFGGQSVFNVIHPFFLTKFGVYVIVFNMEWLSSGASRDVKEDCVSYMTFWLNSIIIHTQNEKEEVASVFFVGTRKDVVGNPSEHLQISTKIYEVFSSSLAWPYVIENLGAEGPNGKADLCFYPVNNKIGHEDETVRKLLRRIEDTMDGSSYVHVERPLSWFQVLDALKAPSQEGKPYLSYEDAKKIIVGCGIPADKVSLVLRFMHEMGILMWHDEDKLRDVVVFDPIEYFVKPATIVICKHVPDEADGIHHVLEIHRSVRKLHARDFLEMTKHGIITEKLLQALIQGHEQSYGHIRELMLKYGLLVPLTLQDQGSEAGGGEISKERLYLAPALLPALKTGERLSLVEGSISTQFYFLFTPSSEVGQMTTISLEDCRHLGFLPHGLFEKLISKAIMWSMKTSDFVNRSTLYGCYKNAAELAFGNQTFRIFADSRHNLISVLVDGKNPVGIHDRLVDQLKEIILECLKSLKFVTMLRYEGAGVVGGGRSDISAHVKDKEKEVLFIRLDQIRAVVGKKTALSLNLAGGRGLLNAQDAMRLYGAWLVDYTAFDEYDMFISYRWGERDSDFTLALFDRMTLYSVEESRRAIRAFLDRKRLQLGENFQSGFLRALLRSLVMVPVVSADALERMTRLEEDDEDNLLIEWICGVECMRGSEGGGAGGRGQRLKKIMPVFFGSRSSAKSTSPSISVSLAAHTHEDHIGNLFQEKMIDQLPSIVPRASLLKAKTLLESNGLSMSEGSMKKTVKEIVEEVCKYLFLCAWDVQGKGNKSLITHTAESILPELESSLMSDKAQKSDHYEGEIHSGVVSHNILSSKRNGDLSSLSLNQLKDMIKNELGISTNNMQEIVTAAFENLTEEQQGEVKQAQTAKEKAILLVKYLGL